MTLLQAIRAWLRPAQDLHGASIAMVGLRFQDNPSAVSEAAYWRDVCEARGFGLPFPRDRVARAILADAARETHSGGFCTILWRFSDGSALTANDAGVVVR